MNHDDELDPNVARAAGATYEPPMKKIKLTIRPYSYECGDGCCSEWGETWSVDGEEVASGPCEHSRLEQLLHHLGFDADVVGENGDGEEVWEL